MRRQRGFRSGLFWCGGMVIQALLVVSMLRWPHANGAVVTGLTVVALLILLNICLPPVPKPETRETARVLLRAFGLPFVLGYCAWHRWRHTAGPAETAGASTPREPVSPGPDSGDER